MIERQRAQAIGVTREGDQAHQVVRAPFAEAPSRHEIPKYLFHHREPVDAEVVLHEIAGAHGSRAVDHHRERDALALDPAHRVTGARARAGDREAEGSEREQQRRSSGEAAAQRSRGTVDDREA